jgi:hypothetical protein
MFVRTGAPRAQVRGVADPLQAVFEDHRPCA